MDDIKHLMQDHFTQFASYVIRERAIPDIVDGLKPVQRRILHTLWMMDDGKLHKVANVAGQTMAFHPHGDAPITDALINMANKNYFLRTQGNFGNLLTGDPAAASRYIETSLSSLAKAVLFNPQLTETVPSYDSRHREPVVLPAKVPVLLMHGAEGIAVGMSTKILPHNFVELLNAEIALLEGRDWIILPDFPTGGMIDASEYARGKGKVKVRAKIEVKDPKTIVIREICYGTTTESLIRSIDEAAKRGRIKIDSINDYTAEKVEIEIKLPRGQYAEDLINALYAYTECETTIGSQIVVIKKGLPIETDVNEILEYHTELLQGYLKRELEIEKGNLLQKIFDKTLERIFIENRLYKKIENLASYEKIHETIEKSLMPFHDQLLRIPSYEDREKLLNIPIRRISRFDLDKNQEEILGMEKGLGEVEKKLKNIKQTTIRFLKDLLKKYGDQYPRRTRIQAFEQVDLRAIEEKTIKVGFDPSSGFVGTKVPGPQIFECSNYDKLLLMFQDGTYKAINIPEKQYVHHHGSKVIYAGAADKKTIFNVCYKNPKTLQCFAKRFVVSKYILDRSYAFIEEGMTLEFFTTALNPIVELQFVPKIKQKISKQLFNFKDVIVKGVTAKGIRMASRPVKKLKEKN